MISNLLDRMKLPFRKNKEFLSALYDILGFYPHDIEIYRIAFSHKSLAYKRDNTNAKDRRGKDRKSRNENTSKPLNNERLEYLGDAVLETVVSDILFRHYPNKREGFLTATRSKIVQREALNRLANEMGLERLIQAAQGTRMDHTNIGGNAFEALMGAIYLDRGFRYCHWFIANRVVGHFVDLDSVAQKEVNFKSKLLEWSQKNRVHISFKDFANEGDQKGFESTVNIEGIVVGRGTGRSKKESQQEASKEALTRMRRDAKLYDSLFRAKEKRTAMEAEESFALPKIDEIEDNLQKGKKGGKNKAASPVLEEKNKKAAPAPAPTPQSISDAAYDTAYDAEANYEVIDQPAEEPIRTAEDYEAIGLPAPPSENDMEIEEEEVKPTKRKSHTPRTVNDAVKGFKRNERTERPEEIKAAQQAERQAKAKKKKEKPATAAAPSTETEKEQPKKAPATVKEVPQTTNAAAEPQPQKEVAPVKQREAAPATPQAPKEKKQEVKAEAEPMATATEVTEMVVATEEVVAEVPAKEEVVAEVATMAASETVATTTEEVAQQPEATAPEATFPTEETMKVEETVKVETTEEVVFEVGEQETQAIEAPVQKEATAEMAAQEEVLNIETANDHTVPAVKVETTIVTSEATEAVEVQVPAVEANEEVATKEEEITDDFIITVDLQPVEAETPAPAQEKEAKKAPKRPKRKPAPAPQAAEQAAMPTEQVEQTNETVQTPLPSMALATDEEQTEANEETEHTSSTPNALSESEPRPMLRHLSMDDFVFGTEPQEQPVLDDLELLEEKPARKSRSSQRRKKRKPAADNKATAPTQDAPQAPKETLQTDWDDSTPQPQTEETPTGDAPTDKKPRRKRRRRPNNNKKKEE